MCPRAGALEPATPGPSVEVFAQSHPQIPALFRCPFMLPLGRTFGWGDNGTPRIDQLGSDEAMKICIISTMIGAPWAGSEALWVAVARTALSDGHEVAVVTKRWPITPPPVADLQARGAKLFLRKRGL